MPVQETAPPPAKARAPGGTGAATVLDRAVARALDGLGAPTGAALVVEGPEAFALRAAAARAAGRTLDLQYYLWHGDLTGTLLAEEVLRAADRGVQVRMLLDDVFALGQERAICALDAHPNIAVRLFNGTRWRAFGHFGYALEMLLGGWHLNRRMHNKAWIADGRLAIAGGRNLADEYFDAAESFNFRDLDLLLVGAAAPEASAVFERYWTSPFARPAAELSAAQSARGGLARLRGKLAAARAAPDAQAFLARSPEGERLSACLENRLAPLAEGAVRVVADPPE
ncbi:phospholipase D-like domain-containing protein, partial [Paracraurococcus ruber]